PRRGFPEAGVLEGSARELAADHAGLIGLLYFPEDAAGPEPVSRHPAARGMAMAFDAAEPLDRIEEPGLATDRQVEARVAVGDDVEPGRLLRVDDARDRVQILLAEDRVAERRLERSPAQALGEPEGPRIRA